MKKLIKTVSAILLATACLTPGLAWAAGNPAVSLEQSGALKASDASGVHSMLVELTFVGADADKVTDVALADAPADTLSSVVYDAATKKATIAVSAGDQALNLSDSLLGKVDVIAQGASADSPVSVEAKLTYLQFIDDADSSTATKDGSVNSDAIVRLTSTEASSPVVNEGQGTEGGNTNTSGGNDAQGGSAGMGYGINGEGGSSLGGDNSSTDGSAASATKTADYKANGVVSGTQTGQSTAGGSTNLVRTGDIALICGIAIAIAALCVFVAIGFTRKKQQSR